MVGGILAQQYCAVTGPFLLEAHRMGALPSPCPGCLVSSHSSYQEEVSRCDMSVLACGPFSQGAFSAFPLPPSNRTTRKELQEEGTARKKVTLSYLLEESCAREQCRRAARPTRARNNSLLNFKLPELLDLSLGKSLSVNMTITRGGGWTILVPSHKLQQ